MVEKPKLNTSLRVLFLSLGMVSLFLAIFELDDLGIWEDLSFVGTVLGLLGIFVGLFPNLVPVKISWKSLLYTIFVVGLGYFVFPVEYEGWTKKWLGSKVYRHIATGMGFAPGEKLGVIRLDPSQEKEMVFLRGKVPDYFILSRSHTYQSGAWSDNEGVQQELERIQVQNLVGADLNLWFVHDSSQMILPIGVNSYQKQEHFHQFQTFNTPAGRIGSAPNLIKDLQVPIELKNQLAKELNQYCPNVNRAFDLYKCMMKYFNAHYTYSYEPNLGSKDPLLDFMREKKGYCAYFATLGVMMFRASGVPARFVEGFAFPESIGRRDYVLRNRNAHSWIEFWNGKSWILMDPTPVSIELSTPQSKFEPSRVVWIFLIVLGVYLMINILRFRRKQRRTVIEQRLELISRMEKYNISIAIDDTIQDCIELVSAHPDFNQNIELKQLRWELIQFQNYRYLVK